MPTKEFMLEIMRYERITLGETEERFLNLITDGPKSAYDIFLHLKAMASKFKTKSMAYKNVHRRIKRLNALGLIEEVEGTFKRRAKKYRLTSRGLFQFLLISPYTKSWSILNMYKDNIIMQTIIYQYFEVETVKELTREPGLVVTSVGLLPDYLRKCCEGILKKIEGFRLRVRIYQERGVNRGQQATAVENMIFDMSELIRQEIRYLSFQIVTTLKYDKPYEEEPKPEWVLAKDKKFICLLQEIKMDFDDGYRKLVKSQ